MKLLEDHKIDKHPSYEPLGYVFTYENNLYRGIYPQYEEFVHDLFQSGLVDKLMENELFPQSELTDYYTSDCNLVIYHEKINVVMLPSEWSFSMLKDAALATLKVNIIARKYGFETKDAHGFNVIFRFGTPIFIDLGSFTRIKNEFGKYKPGWRAYGAFMRSFFAPLKIWSHNDSFFARHALHGEQISMKTYWRYSIPILRLFPTYILDKFEFFYYKYKGLNTRSIEEFLIYASRSEFLERFASVTSWLARKRLLLFSSVDLKNMYRRVSQIRLPRSKTKWDTYQTGMEITKRHQIIVSLINQIDVRTVLDLGGNAGFMARFILSSTNVDHVINTDVDENAIDSLYKRLKTDPANIYPVRLDFGISIIDTKFKRVEERFKSEAVLALAITHHLILSQGMTIDFVLNRISSFSSKYVLIEFMPKGCFSSKQGKIPKVPKDYNIEWFRAKFKMYFTILEERQLETNRVLFLGKLHANGESE